MPAPRRTPARRRAAEAGLLLLSLLSAAAAQAQEVHYSLPHEVADWTFLSGVTVGNFLVDSLEPFTEEPLLDSPYTDRPSVHTSVSGSALHIESGVISAFMTVTPTREGWLTHTNYANFKGFMAGLFASNLLMNLTKVTVGRKRPMYDAEPDDPDSRKSFVSGHATCVWYDWTYLTLFAFEHLGDNHNPWHLFGKSLLAATGVAVSSWVSYTRVDENKHFVSDVVGGAALGAAFALLFYAYQNEWLFPVYERSPSGGSASAASPGASAPQLSFAPTGVVLQF